jgi:hypothetical protein
MLDFCRINNVSEGETSRELAGDLTVTKSLLHDCPGDDQNLDDNRDVDSYPMGKIPLKIFYLHLPIYIELIRINNLDVLTKETRDNSTLRPHHPITLPYSGITIISFAITMPRKRNCVVCKKPSEFVLFTLKEGRWSSNIDGEKARVVCDTKT